MRKFAFFTILVLLTSLSLSAFGGEKMGDVQVTSEMTVTSDQPKPGTMDLVFDTKGDTWTLLSVNAWQEGATKAVPFRTGPYPLIDQQGNFIPWNGGRFILPETVKNEGTFQMPLFSPIPVIAYPKKGKVGMIMMELERGKDGTLKVILCWLKKVGTSGNESTYRLVLSD